MDDSLFPEDIDDLEDIDTEEDEEDEEAIGYKSGPFFDSFPGNLFLTVTEKSQRLTEWRHGNSGVRMS